MTFPTKPKLLITLTGRQIKDALEFVNPDGDADPDQLECELSFYEQEGKLYVFSTDMPEEGSIELPNY